MTTEDAVNLAGRLSRGNDWKEMGTTIGDEEITEIVAKLLEYIEELERRLNASNSSYDDNDGCNCKLCR